MSWNTVTQGSMYRKNITEYKGESRTLHDAQMRNRARWRIRGMGLHLNLPPDRQLLTVGEQKLIKEINEKFDELRNQWTESSKELGFNIKPHTCNSCGKHSDKEYLALSGGVYKNFCRKHYNEFS